MAASGDASGAVRLWDLSGTQFTCFTSTKVQILTPEPRLKLLVSKRVQREKKKNEKLGLPRRERESALRNKGGTPRRKKMERGGWMRGGMGGGAKELRTVTVMRFLS